MFSWIEINVFSQISSPLILFHFCPDDFFSDLSFLSPTPDPTSFEGMRISVWMNEKTWERFFSVAVHGGGQRIPHLPVVTKATAKFTPSKVPGAWN